jgi:hypothetical protein
MQQQKGFLKAMFSLRSVPRLRYMREMVASRMYATERKEGYVLTKFQRGLRSMVVWRVRWNIKSQLRQG